MVPKKPAEQAVSRVLCRVSPGDDHSSRTPVTRGLQRPTRELQAGHLQALPYLVLLRVGFSKLAVSPPPLVSSYLTFSPLPWAYHGGLVSVALSLGLPPLGITQHPALWSSDFPPAGVSCGRRSSGLLRGPLGCKFVDGKAKTRPIQVLFYPVVAFRSMARLARPSAWEFSSRGTWEIAWVSNFCNSFLAFCHRGRRWGAFTR